MHRNYTRERVRISGRDFFWRKFAVCLVRIRTFATFVLLQRSNDAKHKIMTTIKTIISPEQYSAGFFAITPNGECFLIYNDQGEQKSLFLHDGDNTEGLPTQEVGIVNENGQTDWLECGIIQTNDPENLNELDLIALGEGRVEWI
jgi:hypothetical protein